MFRSTVNKARTLALVAGSGLLAASAHAVEGENPVVTMLNSVSVTGIASAVAVICLAVIAIKLTFKGPDVAGRVIKKI